MQLLLILDDHIDDLILFEFFINSSLYRRQFRKLLPSSRGVKFTLLTTLYLVRMVSVLIVAVLVITLRQINASPMRVIYLTFIHSNRSLFKFRRSKH